VANDNLLALVSVLVLPVVITISVLLGALLGGLELDVNRFPAFVTALLPGLTSAMIKNVFEEFAWRGYLAPKVYALKLHIWLCHALAVCLCLLALPHSGYAVDLCPAVVGAHLQPECGLRRNPSGNWLSIASLGHAHHWKCHRKHTPLKQLHPAESWEGTRVLSWCRKRNEHDSDVRRRNLATSATEESCQDRNEPPE
jgi:hypothetical protein